MRGKRPSCHFNVCAAQRIVHPYVVRKLHGSRREVEELIALAHEKGALFWKANGMSSRFSVCPHRQSHDAVHIDHRNHRISVNGGNTLDTVVLVMFGEGVCGIGQFDDARNCIAEALTAIKTTNETMV